MAEPSKCFMVGLGAVYTPPKRPFSGSNVSTTSQGGLGVGSMALPGIIERYIPPTGPFPLDSLFSDATPEEPTAQVYKVASRCLRGRLHLEYASDE